VYARCVLRRLWRARRVGALVGMEVRGRRSGASAMVGLGRAEKAPGRGGGNVISRDDGNGAGLIVGDGGQVGGEESGAGLLS
jgi:hypothetical protein